MMAKFIWHQHQHGTSQIGDMLSLAQKRCILSTKAREEKKERETGGGICWGWICTEFMSTYFSLFIWSKDCQNKHFSQEAAWWNCSPPTNVKGSSSCFHPTFLPWHICQQHSATTANKKVQFHGWITPQVVAHVTGCSLTQRGKKSFSIKNVMSGRKV